METRSSDVADFFQQLALLLRSNLPLPESLRQLGQFFPNHDFQEMLRKAGERTARGEKFSDVIRSYPHYFDSFHLRLIAAGEATGTLPETLLAVAKYARFSQMIVAKLRDILAYPLFTINACVIVVLYMSIQVIPSFAEIFEDLLDGKQLPALTQFVISVGTFINHYRWIAIPLTVVFVVFSFWLFSGSISAHRIMMALINAIPGSWHIVRSLDSARLCNIWSIMTRQDVPLSEAAATASRMVDGREMRRALERIAEMVKSGAGVFDVLWKEQSIDRLLALTFRHAAEDDVPEELGRLAELFEHRVTLSVRSAVMMWTVITYVAMAWAVGTVVVAMFVPLICIVGEMAG